MKKTGYILLVIGLLLGPLGLWGSPQVKSFVFAFKQGSTLVDLSQGGNGSSAHLLLGEFSGGRFLGVKSIVVVGLVDSEGNYRANLDAARARAESVATLIEEKYSWMFVDGRMPISVEVAQGQGTTRSVRVEVHCYEMTPVVDAAPELNLAPAQGETKRVEEEAGVLVLPSARKTYTTPFVAEPQVWANEPMPLVLLKTNLLFDLATAVNLEIEMPIGQRWSILVGGVFPAWNYDNRYCVRILETSLEGRFWFPKPKERLMGHFVGVYGNWLADYDLQWDSKGVMGSGYGFGFTYGYAHSISRNFGLEYSLGVGLMHLNNKSYAVTADYQYKYTPIATSGWRVLPTRAKVSLVWRIGGQKPVRK